MSIKTKKINCYYCNKSFERSISEINRNLKLNQKNFCSKSCIKLYRNNKITMECTNCGNSFTRRKSEIKKSNNHFCTLSCSASYNNKKNKNPKKRCPQCGNMIKNKSSKHCSNICANKTKKEQRYKQIENSGIIHPKGAFYTSSFAKEYITNLNGPNCSICNQHPFWNNKPMIMILDHINGIPDDWRIENLRLVCANCNTQLPTYMSKNIGNGRKNRRKNWTKSESN